ncbi:hypothetical protein FRX31_030250 [Thalictrum thalictroides]|uniref:Uncharacterized protein n=1 Tax=Thalictrum thalictroides TaxID=46969 RepID=A0A7J6V509_THATH|nr:hypothetical protein FRX31_030250 [Thalictrum thalictroides]
MKHICNAFIGLGTSGFSAWPGLPSIELCWEKRRTEPCWLARMDIHWTDGAYILMSLTYKIP